MRPELERLPSLAVVQNRWIAVVLKRTKTYEEAARVLDVDIATLYRWRIKYDSTTRQARHRRRMGSLP